MRKFLLVSGFILFLISSALITAGYGVAHAAFFTPGSFLYPIQDFFEQFHINTTTDPVERFKTQADVTNRRLDDLQSLAGTPNEADAVAAFSLAIDRLITLFAELDPGAGQAVADGRAAIEALLDRANTITAALLVGQPLDAARLNALVVKLDSLRTALADKAKSPKEVEQLVAPLASGQALPAEVTTPNWVKVSVPPHVVLFPPGSAGAEHKFFPLAGKHAALGCDSCHKTGIYAGTANTCVACHEKELPANHFPGDCAACHTPEDWKLVNFDHAANLANDCLSCHTPHRPEAHFAGQCSLCHSTSAWKPAEFNHSGVSNCTSCHEAKRPAGHYAGECGACHSTTAWKPAHFDHAAAGAADCQTCHAKEKPANHYNAQCSQCHNTSAWLPASFNHAAAGVTSCTGCHEAKRPGGHYQGDCAPCHSTSAWTPANFSHSAAGATDCLGCHSAKAPAGHYSGQCSQCHTTTAWTPANFNHSAAGATDCQSCHTKNKPAGHYSGQCSACHSTSAWTPASFNHAAAGATNCQGCHTPPSPHFSGECSQCHSTDSWRNVNFNHSFPMDHGAASSCSSCHPGGGSDWTCDGCHNPTEMNNTHTEKGISDIGGRCLECHPTGKND